MAVVVPLAVLNRPSSASLSVVLPSSSLSQSHFCSFTLAISESLFRCGVVAPQLESYLEQLVCSFGVKGALFVTPTGLFISLNCTTTTTNNAEADEQQQNNGNNVHFIRIKGISLDMKKLALLENVLEDVIKKQLPLVEATARVQSILTRAPKCASLDRIMDILAYTFGSASIAILFNGGWREVLATGLVGFAVGIAQLLLSSFQIGNSRVVEPLLAFLGTLFAHFLHRWLHHLSLFIVALGGIIMLVPGFTLTLGMIELTARNLVCGTARLSSAILTLMLLAFGIITGTKFSTVILGRQVDVAAQSLSAWLIIPATLIATTAFGITMRIRWQPKLWIIVLICGAVAVAISRYGVAIFGDSATAFVGALAVSLLTNIYARIFRDGKAVAATMIGITLLVPGSLGVRGLTAIFQGSTDEGIRFVASMFAIGLQIAVGVTVGNLFLPLHVIAVQSHRHEN